jgi:hypothetical protein
MGMGTAGAVLDAIARMRQIEREMARTRRGHVRPLRKRDGGASDRLPFPCFFLCGDCGWLEEGTTGHPLRRDGDEVSAPGPCPACHAKAWVDLRRQSVALAYREAEAMDRTLASDRGRSRSVWIGGLTSMAVIAVAMLVEPAVAGLGRLLLVALLGTWLATTLAVGAILHRMRSGSPRLRRWRRALPRPSARGSAPQASHGVAQGDAVLDAPMSRVPCLGWAVQVWSDEGLVLDEQHHAAFTLDGHPHAPDSVALELPRGNEVRIHPGDEAVVRFMQRRGLSPHDASLRVYEACLVPGAPVT